MKSSTNGRAKALDPRTADPLDLLRQDLSSLKRDMASLLGGGIDSAAGHTRHAVDSAKETIAELAEQGRERADEAHLKLGETAGARPITTILIAMAAGAVLAKALGVWSRR